MACNPRPCPYGTLGGTFCFMCRLYAYVITLYLMDFIMNMTAHLRPRRMDTMLGGIGAGLGL